MELIAKTSAQSQIAAATIRLDPHDDVLIARQPLPAGLVLEENAVVVQQAIPAGHKVAVRRIEAGENVRRYGQIIGVASVAIDAGAHVHSHNLGMAHFSRSHAFGIDAKPTPHREATFMGIVRPDGRVATRNYIGVLTSVNCSATVARAPRSPRALSGCGWRGRADTRYRLRGGPWRRSLGDVAANPGWLCGARQLPFGADDWPGLRNQPDRRLAHCPALASRPAPSRVHPGW